MTDNGDLIRPRIAGEEVNGICSPKIYNEMHNYYEIFSNITQDQLDLFANKVMNVKRRDGYNNCFLDSCTFNHNCLWVELTPEEALKYLKQLGIDTNKDNKTNN